MQTFIDVHCHLFNIAHVPLLTFLKRYGAGLQIAAQGVPLLQVDDRVREFIQTSGSSCREILRKALHDACKATEAEALVLIPLMMDMSFEDPGKVHKDQIQDTMRAIQAIETDCRQMYVRIMPFIGLDPNCYNQEAPNIRERLQERLSLVKSTRRHGDIIGIKLYPPLGAAPDHPVLVHPGDGVYAYCINQDIPITVHCSPGGFYSGYIPSSEARKLSDPKIWKEILTRFPSLRLNLAHFGGVEEWHRRTRGNKSTWVDTIVEIITNPLHPNVYTDMAYLAQDRAVLKQIRRLTEKHPPLREKILFGTDYYLVRKEMDYGQYVLRARDEKKGLGKDLFEQFADANPRNFLKLN